jgi:CDP-diacylglycerol--glycerol-3-phosphate 3-phosphatidyltransferase
MSGETRTVGRRLAVEWLVFVGVAVGIAASGVWLVSEATDPSAGRRWLLVAGTVLAYEVGFLAYHLPRARDGVRGPVPRGTLGAANAVTLVRGVLFAGAAGFLLVPPSSPLVRWAPGVCYGAGAALDYVDGILARRRGRTTELGTRLDHAFDTLGFLVAPLVGVAWGRLPVWYLSLSAARYVFRAGRAWRLSTGRRVDPLPESRLRRRLAAFQMAFITVALLPVVPSSIVHPAAAVALAPSLTVFARDWLVVAGHLPQRED